MRGWFWGGVGAMGLGGVASYVGIPLPDSGLAEELGGWYLGQLLLCAILGAGLGLWAGKRTRYRITHIPRESAAQFQKRIVRSGIVAAAGASLVIPVLTFFVGLPFLDAPVFGLFNLLREAIGFRAVALPLIVCAAAGLGFAIRISTYDWGGKYVLSMRHGG
jgi:hypothetical protein